MSDRSSPAEVVYSAASSVSSPRHLVSQMLADMHKGRELAWRLFVRDISARYRQSVLGMFWAFAPPIMMGLIFVVLNARKVIDFGDVGMPYPVYAFLGTLLWQTFADSVTAPITVVTGAKPMIAKINFPREALILCAIYHAVFGLAIRTPVMLVVMLAFGVIPGWEALASLVPLACMVVLGVAFGLLLTPLGMLYTDVTSALGVVIQLWFFVTPVVYATPQTFPFSLIALLNPVSPLLMQARALLTGVPEDLWLNTGVVAALSAFAFLYAWLVMRVAMPILTERMSA